MRSSEQKNMGLMVVSGTVIAAFVAAVGLAIWGYFFPDGENPGWQYRVAIALGVVGITLWVAIAVGRSKSSK